MLLKLPKITSSALALLSILLFGGTPVAAADKITLKLNNGGLVVTGDLLNYDGLSYLVRSDELGEIKVDAKKFTCISVSCPQATTKNASLQGNIPVAKDFAIHGSNTIGAKLMPALIEGYMRSVKGSTKRILGAKSEEIKLILQSNSGVKLASIDLHSHGSGTSAPGLASGLAQIGMSSRPIKTNEIERLENAGITGIKRRGNENILALDGLIVIVSPESSIKSLSIEQIAKIFSGEITDWAQVGRITSGPINVYSRSNVSGTYDTFKSLVLKPFKLKLSPEAKLYESSPDLSDEVANDPNGIGFVGFAYKRNAKTLSISSACGISKEPTLFNVKTEEYPLARRLYLYSTQNTLRSPIAQKILHFALSDDAQEIIPGAGYINQSIHSLPFNNQGSRIATVMDLSGENLNMEMIRQFTKEFVNAERLSVTFRFKTGSTQLSNKSHADVKRFVKLLQQNKFIGKELFLVGFSDDVGAFDKNRELALKRALSIKLAILAASAGTVDVDRLQLRSYGELFPVSCNNTSVGQSKNRRVEVWVK